MKITIKEPQKEKKNIIPEVGQFWRHTNDYPESIYRRIEDEIDQESLGYFYSYSLQGNFIAKTSKTSDNIQLLEVELIVTPII